MPARCRRGGVSMLPEVQRKELHGELDELLDALPRFGTVQFTIAVRDGRCMRVDRTVSATLRVMDHAG